MDELLLSVNQGFRTYHLCFNAREILFCRFEKGKPNFCGANSVADSEGETNSEFWRRDLFLNKDFYRKIQP